MIFRSCGSIKWLEFELFQDLKDFSHAVFLREGGVSLSPYDSLNLGFSTEDDPGCPPLNLQKALAAFQINEFKRGRFVHGNTILMADEAGESFCDGLATKQEELALITTHADCQAAIIYDPINRALATAHAGWRGNVAHIYKEAIEFMKYRFNSKVVNLLAAVSPSLGPNHAEFIDYERLFPTSFYKFKKESCRFDLWALAEWQFLELGLLQSHIQIAKRCTYEEANYFFSYRRDKKTGRNATFAALRKKKASFL